MSNTNKTRTLATVAAAFKGAINSEATARVKAATLAFEYVVTLGGKNKDLAAKAGITEGKASKHVAAGKALALMGDSATPEQVTAIVRTAHGEQGDKPALTEAVKAEDTAGVVAASAVGTKSSDKGETSKASKAKSVTLDKMDTDALLNLLSDAAEALAKRDDVRGENADRFGQIGKSIVTIAKNLAAVPVA